MALLTERYTDRIAGVLSCFDRIIATGTLPGACYAAGMTSFLNAHGIRIFDYPQFALPLRERVREQAQALAEEHGVTIEHITKSHIRKEEVVAKVLATRGEHPGLVHVISAMETCQSYKPWHDKRTGKTFLRPDTGKCLHYYFYWMDAKLGLIYLRSAHLLAIPTAVLLQRPFLAGPETCHEGIDFAMADNAFIRIEDWTRAQELADTLKPESFHKILDRYAEQCCPVLDVFVQRYHWSLMQVEYSTDLVFRSPQTLGPLYDELSRQAVLAVKAEQVSSFLGKMLTPQVAAEIGSRFTTRIEGTCISTASAPARSSSMTSSTASYAWKPPPTTFPSSSTTARWNIATATPPANSHP